MSFFIEAKGVQEPSLIIKELTAFKKKQRLESFFTKLVSDSTNSITISARQPQRDYNSYLESALSKKIPMLTIFTKYRL